jgi:hypothetical protein
VGVALIACGHGDPFPSPDHRSDVPLVAGAPTRLTYNPGVDRDAAWLPDESGLLYSVERLDRGDDDRCLALLPPDGGRVIRTYCAGTVASHDSLDTFDAAAVSGGGRVAFVRTTRPTGQVIPHAIQLVVARFDSIGTATVQQGIPFTVGTRLYTGAARLRWADETALIYRAGFAAVACIGPGLPCPTAFVESGIDLMRQAADPGSAPTPIPGTTYASSVALEPGGDAIFFTLLGDTRVYRQVLSTGATTILFDVGAAAGIARDVQVSASRMVVLAGGQVQVLNPAWNDPNGPALQYEQGGRLVVVDLATGTQSQIGGNILYRNPALSPSGKRLVAEAGGDLWLFDLP